MYVHFLHTLDNASTLSSLFLVEIISFKRWINTLSISTVNFQISLGNIEFLGIYMDLKLFFLNTFITICI